MQQAFSLLTTSRRATDLGGVFGTVVDGCVDATGSLQKDTCGDHRTYDRRVASSNTTKLWFFEQRRYIL